MFSEVSGWAFWAVFFHCKAPCLTASAGFADFKRLIVALGIQLVVFCLYIDFFAFLLTLVGSTSENSHFNGSGFEDWRIAIINAIK